MLRSWLLSPSSEEVTINGRLDVVDEFISNQEMRSAVRKLLHLYGNVDGVLSTLVKIQSESSVRSSVRLVKSYLQLQRNCELMPQFYQVLSKCTSELTRVIASICHQKEWDDLHSLLGQFFDSDFNVSMNGLSKHQLCLCLKTGIDASLDVNRSVYFQAIEDTIALIKTYQQQYSFELKMVNNASRGYHLIVSSKNRAFLSDDFFNLGKERSAQIAVSTQDLMSLNRKCAECQAAVFQIVNELLNQIADHLRKYIAVICKGNDALSLLDVLSSFAVVATEAKMTWTRPKFNSGNMIALKQSWRQPCFYFTTRPSRLL